jgi:hypothetical protein
MTDEERRARFEAALHYGGDTHGVDDVLDMVREGTAQFWSNGDGCIVTEILKFPRFDAVNYWLISGELRACLALEEQITAFAIERGAKVAMATGRRGWGRVAAPTGWRPHMHTFWKPLP